MMKMFYLALGGVLLLLGLVGLVIPIIPGIIFLFLAALVLSKVSRRVRAFTDSHPGMQQIRARMQRAEQVDWVDRIRLAGWMGLEALVQAARSTHLFVRRAFGQ